MMDGLVTERPPPKQLQAAQWAEWAVGAGLFFGLAVLQLAVVVLVDRTKDGLTEIGFQINQTGLAVPPPPPPPPPPPSVSCPRCPACVFANTGASPTLVMW